MPLLSWFAVYVGSSQHYIAVFISMRANARKPALENDLHQTKYTISV